MSASKACDSPSVASAAQATGLQGTGSGGTYLQPGSILQGRILRIGAVFTW